MAKNTDYASANALIQEKKKRIKPAENHSNLKSLKRTKEITRYTDLELNEFVRAHMIYGLSYSEIVKEYKLYPVDGPTLSKLCRDYVYRTLTTIKEAQSTGIKLKEICIDLCIEKDLYKAMIKYVMPEPKYNNPLYLAGCKDLDIYTVFDDYARNYKPVPKSWIEKYYGKK